MKFNQVSRTQNAKNISKQNKEKSFEQSNTQNKRTQLPKKNKNSLQVNSSFTTQEIALQACEELGYDLTDSYYDSVLFLYESASAAGMISSLWPWQFANHFPATLMISTKNSLAKVFAKMQSFSPSLFDFHPKSFILPDEASEFKSYFQKNPGTFIIKPDQESCGRGIRLIQDLSSIKNYSHIAVCQEYISPFLIKGLKFDLRIYVLITSVDPLRVYIHRENMVRFCTHKYQPPSTSNLKNVYCHLTNYSINKDSSKFIENQNEQDELYAHKRGTTSVFSELKDIGVDTETLQQQIDDIIRFTLIAVQPIYIRNYKSCVKVQDERSRIFEILGFDIIVDENLKPWLLEVNNTPSMEIGSSFDATLKLSVMKGAFQILNLKQSFKKKLEKNNSLKYNEIKEFERAEKTNWRKLLPIEYSDPSYSAVHAAMDIVKTSPPIEDPIPTKQSILNRGK